MLDCPMSRYTRNLPPLPTAPPPASGLPPLPVSALPPPPVGLPPLPVSGPPPLPVGLLLLAVGLLLPAVGLLLPPISGLPLLAVGPLLLLLLAAGVTPSGP